MMSGEASFNEINLRHAFVAMLFAFAISRVGESAIVVFNHVSENSLFEAVVLASLLHIFLAVIVITTSWVGWSHSALNSKEVLEGPFQRAYLLLIVDIILVINYYGLALSIDLSKEIGKISVVEEAVSISVVFFLYFVWEVARIREYNRGIFSNLSAVSKALFMAGLVLVFALYLNTSSIYFLLGVDLSLVSVVIFFRALKKIERGDCLELENTHKFFFVTYLLGLLISLVDYIFVQCLDFV